MNKTTNNGSNSSTTSSSDFLMDSGLDMMLVREFIILNLKNYKLFKGDFVANNSPSMTKICRLDATNGLLTTVSTPPSKSPFNDSGCFILNNSNLSTTSSNNSCLFFNFK